MTVSARMETFDRELELLIDEELSPEAFSREFGKAARQIIEKQDAENDRAAGRDVRYKTFVDGRQSKDLEKAKTRIVAEWDLGTTIFQDIMMLLRNASPVLKGEYRDSISLFHNNRQVSISNSLASTGEYFFAATVPYARKIERGVSSQAPNGVFEAVAAVASKRFGNIARIRFTFRDAIDSSEKYYIARRSGRKAAGSAVRNSRQPVILVEFGQ